MDECYNKHRDAFRVWKFSRDGTTERHKYYLNGLSYYGLNKNNLENDEFRYEKYPYRFYSVYCFCWWLRKICLHLWNWLIKDDYKHLLWLIIFVVGTALTIIGLCIKSK